MVAGAVPQIGRIVLQTHSGQNWPYKPFFWLGWPREAHGLQTFVKHVAKVDSPRFLNRDQARNVIAGLQQWKNHIDGRAV